jgi:hypothetical protein
MRELDGMGMGYGGEWVFLLVFGISYYITRMHASFFFSLFFLSFQAS